MANGTYGKTTASEIDRKLRDDFRRRLKDYGVTAETADPILAVLFRTFAVQLEGLYSDTDRIRLALLDELIDGLGIGARLARPAQTVLRFFNDGPPQYVEAGTELIGEAQSGERLTFVTDVPLLVSTARIAMALAYQNDALRLLPAVEMPDAIQSARPSLDPARANLGPNPALFLAVDEPPESHIGQHGFFFELSPYSEGIQRALRHETWCLADQAGQFGGTGILRPRRMNAGVLGLEWLIDGRGRGESDPHDAPLLPDGFYAGRVFIFPVVPQPQRFLCRIPAGMETALTSLFGQRAGTVFQRPRVWLRISMPPEIPDLASGVSAISLHAVSASNVECVNQTVQFERIGTSIPVARDSGANAHLVAPITVLGECGADYLPERAPSADPYAGRYRIHSGRIHFRPARTRDGGADTYANLRLWMTAGSLGNKVGPGQIHAFLKQAAAPALRVSSPTSAAGGTDGESGSDAQARLAEALLSRERIVTMDDAVAAVCAFDRRLGEVSVSAGLQRTPHGMARALQIECALVRADFTDPEQESRVLREELELHLQARVHADTVVGVRLRWGLSS